jgi:hypothetical protein
MLKLWEEAIVVVRPRHKSHSDPVVGNDCGGWEGLIR